VSTELVVLLVGAALVVGLCVGWVAALLLEERDMEQQLHADELRWRRIDWNNRLDRRRLLKRRFIEDNGRAQW